MIKPPITINTIPIIQFIIETPAIIGAFILSFKDCKSRTYEDECGG